MSVIAANAETVYRRIALAAQRGGQKADEVILLAVTKTHPLEIVIEGYEAGLRHFGENRVQEGLDKSAAMLDWQAREPDREATHWHFIGHLQSRQVGALLTGKFALVHSVDSLKLAQRIDRLARRENRPPIRVLLQCNVSGEETKSGFELTNWAQDNGRLQAFLSLAAQIASLEKVIIQGLMTMAPLTGNPEAARPIFRSLAVLNKRLKTEMPGIDWRHLSMGMTDDFEVAIEEGATIVRVGRAIFGERNE